jgi:hypothetical protein
MRSAGELPLSTGWFSTLQCWASSRGIFAWVAELAESNCGTSGGAACRQGPSLEGFHPRHRHPRELLQGQTASVGQPALARYAMADSGDA